MSRKYQIPAGLLIGLAFVSVAACFALDVAANLDKSFSDFGTAPTPFLCYPLAILAAASFLCGCSSYARAKGYHPAWGLLGLLNLPGLIILMLLRDLDSPPPLPGTAEARRIIDLSKWYRRDAQLGIGLGFAAIMLSWILFSTIRLLPPNPTLRYTSGVGSLVFHVGGLCALIWGCRRWAMAKGYTPALGWLGLFGCFGSVGLVILLYFLPDRNRALDLSSAGDLKESRMD